MKLKSKPEKLVIVGGGFGGLACAKALRGSGYEIVLIDQHNHHLFQPLLYQVATSVLPASEIAWPLRRIFRRRKDIRVLMARVQDVDRSARQVHLEGGGRISYDRLVLATGARHSYFGQDHWEQCAPGLKSLSDAQKIREKILCALEAAEGSADLSEQASYLNFFVVGAGPTGVELAGIIADLAYRVLPGEFREIDPLSVKITLIEAGDRVLPGFTPSQSSYAQRSLERLGVNVRTNVRVTNCTADQIELETTSGAEAHATHTVLWAAGVKASPAAGWSGSAQDSSGRALVESNLSASNHPEISLIGDTVGFPQADGSLVPGNAPAAKQMGQFVARKLRTERQGRRFDQAFAYHHAGNLATIGRRTAVADFGWLKLRGPLAWWVWGSAHIFFLISLRSRAIVMLSWLWSYVSGQNSARLISK